MVKRSAKSSYGGLTVIQRVSVIPGDIKELYETNQANSFANSISPLQSLVSLKIPKIFYHTIFLIFCKLVCSIVSALYRTISSGSTQHAEFHSFLSHIFGWTSFNLDTVAKYNRRFDVRL